MSVLTQPPSMGDVLKYELNPNFTREPVTLLAGTTYPAGAVLGRVTASGAYTLSSESGTDGSEVAAGVLLYAVDATGADATGIALVRGPALACFAQICRKPDHCCRKTGCLGREALAPFPSRSPDPPPTSPAGDLLLPHTLGDRPCLC